VKLAADTTSRYRQRGEIMPAKKKSTKIRKKAAKKVAKKKAKKAAKKHGHTGGTGPRKK